MTLTKEDLSQIRSVIDEAIASHPRFDELELKIEEQGQRVIDDIAEQMQDGFMVIGGKFDELEARVDELTTQR
jgi:hypothetical protein